MLDNYKNYKIKDLSKNDLDDLYKLVFVEEGPFTDTYYYIKDEDEKVLYKVIK